MHKIVHDASEVVPDAGEVLHVPDGRRLGCVNVICVGSIHMCEQEGEKKLAMGIRQGD